MPSLTDLASHFGGEVVGNGNVAIDAVASLSEAKAGQLSFYESSLPKQVLLESKAAAVLLKKEVAADCPLPMWVVSKTTPLLCPSRQSLKCKTGAICRINYGHLIKSFCRRWGGHS